MSPYLEDGVVCDMVNPRTPEPRSFLNKRDFSEKNASLEFILIKKIACIMVKLHQAQGPRHSHKNGGLPNEP